MRTLMTRRNQSFENLGVSQEEQMIHNPSGWKEFGTFQKVRQPVTLNHSRWEEGQNERWEGQGHTVPYG